MRQRDQPAGQVASGVGPIVSATSMVDAHPWRFAFLLLAALWAVLAITGFLASQAGPREPVGGSWEELVYSGPLASFVSYWQRWDALWYQQIAQNGYAAGNGTAAFFPLYPLLSRIASILFAGNVLLGELAVSAAASVGAITLLWRLVDVESGGRAARAWVLPFVATPRLSFSLKALTVLLTVLFPVGFVLLAPYTESLFLLFTVATLLLARTGHPWLAGLMGLLAGLTRIQGVFLALPIAYEYLSDRQTWAWIRRQGGRAPGLGLLAATLPAVGLAIVTAFQWLVIGERRSGLDLQSIWGLKVALPWDVLAASWAYMAGGAHNDSFAFVEAFNAACLLGAVAIVIAGARRLPVAYTLYALPSLGLLSFREMYFSPLMSVGRYVLVVFPVFMIAASWLAPRPKIAAAILIVSGLLELVFFQYWVRWGFVA
ncbi:MAG: hypothetical protein ABIZ30_03790 [Candidatus Limnocylindrales bacterium]